jgi:oligopeptide transport system substrate-binding protein
LYILAQHFGCPLPCQVLVQFREAWWKEEHILCNGPFILKDVSEDEWVLERNPHYFKSVQGNVDTLHIVGFKEPERLIESYITDKVDIATASMTYLIPDSVSKAECYIPPRRLWNLHFLLNPSKPPTDNLLVRRAIAHAVNRKNLKRASGSPVRETYGGLVPPGMPGHSPDIALVHDLGRAQEYLYQAGFSGEYGDTKLEIWQYHQFSDIQQVAQDIQHFLGIPVEIQKGWDLDSMLERSPHLVLVAWLADFPDPINFLVEGAAKPLQQLSGWSDPHFNNLLEEATREPDRKTRMERYRAADRYLVAEQALFIPLSTDLNTSHLVKPWIKNFRQDTLGYINIENIIVEGENRIKE